VYSEWWSRAVAALSFVVGENMALASKGMVAKKNVESHYMHSLLYLSSLLFVIRIFL
jgi:hypothetical protein